MSRKGLEWQDGFPIYTPRHLAKVNALRRVNSMVGREGVPIPDRASVLFSTAESANFEPRSCFNCPLYKDKIGRCVIHSNSVKIWKFTKGAEDGNAIEYWPVCGYWVPGIPGLVSAHLCDLDPDDTGLGWINAPAVGLDFSGSNCGGGNNGDDCDFYTIEGTGSKMNAPTGFCRVLQSTVGNGDCCSEWRDDDWVEWRTAQDWLKERP